MNDLQKVFVLIFLISFIMWVTFGATYPNRSVFFQSSDSGFGGPGGYNIQYIATWYQVVLLAVWISSIVAFFIYKD